MAGCWTRIDWYVAQPLLWRPFLMKPMGKVGILFAVNASLALLVQACRVTTSNTPSGDPPVQAPSTPPVSPSPAPVPPPPIAPSGPTGGSVDASGIERLAPARSGVAPLSSRADAAVFPSSPPETPRKLAGAPQDMLACKTDADCAITCRFDGDCCAEQCGCSQPMSHAFSKRLERHLAESCGPEPVCPVASCVGTKKYKARCDAGTCVARKLPGSV
jgi:hypothetical protein